MGVSCKENWQVILLILHKKQKRSILLHKKNEYYFMKNRKVVLHFMTTAGKAYSVYFLTTPSGNLLAFFPFDRFASRNVLRSSVISCSVIALMFSSAFSAVSNGWNAVILTTRWNLARSVIPDWTYEVKMIRCHITADTKTDTDSKHIRTRQKWI